MCIWYNQAIHKIVSVVQCMQMIYVFSALFAVFIVLGQSLWKIGIERSPIKLDSIQGLFSREAINLVLSPYMIVGFAVYGFATLIYITLISRYDYSLVQSLTIPLTLICAYFVAGIFFKEQIITINVLGVLLIIIGVVLAVKR